PDPHAKRTSTRHRARLTSISLEASVMKSPHRFDAERRGLVFVPSRLRAFKTGRAAMPKFMSSHTLPPGAMKREQVNQLAEAAKNDPVIKPYRSFCNLSAGKIFCVMEAPDEKSLAAWFDK